VCVYQDEMIKLERMEVFVQAVEAVVVIDEITEALPSGRAYMRDQLRRAANSVALNIAEGAGEYLPLEKCRFYRMAKRSSTECVGQLYVCRRLGVVDTHQLDDALSLLDRVIAMLVALIKAQLDRAAREQRSR
jgi:four helix bundle protein